MTSKVFMICTAYESGIGQGLQGRTLTNPYASGTDEHEAWEIGHKLGMQRFEKSKVREPKGQPLCEVATRIGVKSGDIIKFLFVGGIYATLTQELDYTTIGLIEAHFKATGVQPAPVPDAEVGESVVDVLDAMTAASLQGQAFAERMKKSLRHIGMEV